MSRRVETSDRSRVRRILIIVFFLNVLVAQAKLIVGWLIGSVAMLADGFHSLTDSASNVVGLVGVAASARPPDADHPYGHRKFETLAALVIGGLLALTAWEVLQRCIERLRAGGAPQVTRLGFYVMGITMATNLAVATYERRRARSLRSEVLRADAVHTQSDIYTSCAVIASLVAARYGFPHLDLVAALAITGFIAWSAFQILRENALLLSDVAVIPPHRLREVAESVSEVVSAHKIRTRGLPDAAYADLHVQVSPSLRLDEAHLIGHRVAERLRRELRLHDVVVHVEPPEGHRTESTLAEEAEEEGGTTGGARADREE